MKKRCDFTEDEKQSLQLQSVNLGIRTDYA